MAFRKKPENSKYEFILANKKFSFSAITTYEHCPYAYKLLYIDDIEDRIDNFYGEYGRLVHNCLEEYFKKNIDIYEMRNYFENNYNKMVVSCLPDYPRNIDKKYYKQALDFFSNFSFDWDIYDVVVVENTLRFDLFGYKFTGRPDLILRNKKEKENILLDFKTSKPFYTNRRTGKEVIKTDRINKYKKQLYLYTYGYKQAHDEEINKMQIWFTRPSRKMTFLWNYEEEKEALLWAENLLHQIWKEETFPYNNKEKYFCDFLCSARNVCEFRK